MTFPVFQRVGGTDTAIEIVRRRTGQKFSRYAPLKWQTERKLPAYVQVALMWELLERGLIPKLEDFSYKE